MVSASVVLASRNLFCCDHLTCPRPPLLVLEAREQYVGSRRYHVDGEGDLFALDSAHGMTHLSELSRFRNENNTIFLGLEHTCALNRLSGEAAGGS